MVIYKVTGKEKGELADLSIDIHAITKEFCDKKNIKLKFELDKDLTIYIEDE